VTETLLTKREAAERLHISVWATEQLINKGLLPVVPVGARVRIRPADVDSYVKTHAGFLPKGRVRTRTTESITKSVASRGVALEKDLRDAIHAAPAELIKADKKAAQKAKKAFKKARKKQKKLTPDPAVGPLPTGSLPGSAIAANKGIFGAQITKDGRSTFAVDSPVDMQAELMRQLHSENPALRLAAEKALTPEPPRRAADDPAYWRGLAESPLSTAAEKIQYLAKAERLENERRTSSRPGFTLGPFAQ
jgi:excisionase family DNA binding protein